MSDLLHTHGGHLVPLDLEGGAAAMQDALVALLRRRGPTAQAAME